MNKKEKINAIVLKLIIIVMVVKIMFQGKLEVSDRKVHGLTASRSVHDTIAMSCLNRMFWLDRGRRSKNPKDFQALILVKNLTAFLNFKEISKFWF